MSAPPALTVSNLMVRYGDLVGVADVSLSVPPGTIVALLGSNGAGKTTTLNAIAGLVPPAGGSITWQGTDIAGDPAFAIVRTGLALAPVRAAMVGTQSSPLVTGSTVRGASVPGQFARPATRIPPS